MIVGVREFLRTSTGHYVAIALAAVALGVCVWSIMTSFGANEAAQMSADRLFVCAETGRPFELELQAGMKIPASSPHSGKDTGYPAELCYWTKAGTTKDEPTPVLLNGYVGKSEPTFCPDCDRVVVAHNPYPEPGARPPRTRAQVRK